MSSINYWDGTKWVAVATAGAVGPAGPKGDDGAPGADGAAGADGLGFNPVGQWAQCTDYNVRDVVTYNGSSYVQIAAPGDACATPDSDPTAWQLLAAEGPRGPNCYVQTTEPTAGGVGELWIDPDGVATSGFLPLTGGTVTGTLNVQKADAATEPLMFKADANTRDFKFNTAQNGQAGEVCGDFDVFARSQSGTGGEILFDNRSFTGNGGNMTFLCGTVQAGGKGGSYQINCASPTEAGIFGVNTSTSSGKAGSIGLRSSATGAGTAGSISFNASTVGGRAGDILLDAFNSAAGGFAGRLTVNLLGVGGDAGSATFTKGALNRDALGAATIRTVSDTDIDLRFGRDGIIRDYHVQFESAGSTPRRCIVPPNATYPYQIGSVVDVHNNSGATLEIDPGAGVTVHFYNGTTGATALGTGVTGTDSRVGVRRFYGAVRLVKVATDVWNAYGDTVLIP